MEITTMNKNKITQPSPESNGPHAVEIQADVKGLKNRKKHVTN